MMKPNKSLLIYITFGSVKIYFPILLIWIIMERGGNKEYTIQQEQMLGLRQISRSIPNNFMNIPNDFFSNSRKISMNMLIKKNFCMN